MSLTETIRRWRRLRRFHATVAKAVRDPAEIDRLAERSGFNPELIRQCVGAIRGSRAQLRLSADKTATTDEIHSALLERARRAICMLIEMAGPRCDPHTADAVMNSLTEAMVARDHKHMTRICRLVERRGDTSSGVAPSYTAWQTIGQELRDLVELATASPARGRDSSGVTGLDTPPPEGVPRLTHSMKTDSSETRRRIVEQYLNRADSMIADARDHLKIALAIPVGRRQATDEIPRMIEEDLMEVARLTMDVRIRLWESTEPEVDRLLEKYLMDVDRLAAHMHDYLHVHSLRTCPPAPPRANVGDARASEQLHFDPSTVSSIMLARSADGAAAPQKWMQPAEDLPFETGGSTELLQLVSSLVECVWGNPDVREALSSVSWHTRSALASSGAHGPDDVLLVVVRCIEREKRRLEQLAEASAEEVASALDLLAGESLDRDLWWFMSGAQPAQSGTTRANDPIPHDVDLAWTALRRFARARAQMSYELAALEKQRLSEPVTRVRAIQETFPETGDRRIRLESGEALTVAVRGIETERSEPEGGRNVSLGDALTVALLREIESEGTLSWPACIRLVNARAWPHRYVDAWQRDGALHVSVDGLSPRTDGSIELYYRALEQPLSYRFRSYFETLSTDDRVRVLTKLVDYALNACEAAVVVARGEEIEQHMRAREEDLWKHVNRMGASS